MMNFSFKIALIMFLSMGLAAFFIISLDSFFDFPDELSGALYFISIGIAVSSVLNYYRD
tara:strand:- start:186 stop:362 length:177 start_codon:yes stop_codon:yes gene_type:complete